VSGHRPMVECGHCWAERNGKPDPSGDSEIVICEECDKLWPCPDAPLKVEIVRGTPNTDA